MEGFDRIEQRIREDADAKIAETERAAAEQIEALHTELDEQLEHEREQTMLQARQSADERRERLASAAEMEAKKLRLAAKQEILGEAFELALDQLCGAPQEQQVKLLTRLVHEASPRGTGALIVAPHDRALGMRVVEQANETYDAYFTLSDETRPIRGGFILSQGDMEVNCAYEALIRLRRSALEQEVAQILFP